MCHTPGFTQTATFDPRAAPYSSCSPLSPTMHPPVPITNIIIFLLLFTVRAAKQSKDQPLVPIGATATLMFLVSGLKSFRDGKPARSQTMMRGRVAAQGFTVIAMTAYAVSRGAGVVTANLEKRRQESEGGGGVGGG